MKKYSDTLKWLMSRRVGVLYGGLSSESAVSRRTGKAVLRAFRELGVNAAGIEADRSLALKLSKQRINYCFIALHGKYGEDGTVQGLCEILGIPYSGSGVLASALCMNKELAKKIFVNSGIPTLPFRALSKKTTLEIPRNLTVPCVVKPVDSGSAIGVSIVKNKSGLAAALRTAFRQSNRIIVEKFGPGRELTAAVLGEKVLPLIEIIPKKSFYDYQAKYQKGMSLHIMPAKIPTRAAAEVRRLTLKAHHALGCRGFSRVDFILSPNGKLWTLEVNSIPGMTETSLFPEAARSAGYTFPEMILEIVRTSRNAQ